VGYVEQLQEEAKRRDEIRRFKLPLDRSGGRPAEGDEKEDARHDTERLEEYRRLLREARTPKRPVPSDT
jgi:hypothetical protein